MMIFPPDDPQEPAEWAAVFAGHVFVGFALAALAVWLGWPIWTAPAGYLVLWETAAQQLGAGWRDAVVDGWAVALGAGCLWSAWGQNGSALGVCIALAVVSVAVGIGKRMN